MSVTLLLNKVEDITKRPDARSRALTALNKTLSHICNNADYGEDLIETSLTNPTPSQWASVIPLTLDESFPPIRKFEYVVMGGLPLKSIKPRNAIGAKGCQEQGVWYRSGNSLVVNAQRPDAVVRVGYYQQTPYVEDTLDATHWLIEEQELMVIEGVCAEVFRMTGADQDYATYKQSFDNLYSEFRRMRVDTEEV